MMRALSAACVAAAMAFGASAAAAAPSGGDRWQQALERFDANGDGMIGLDEVQAVSAERFARRDRDGDGFLSHAEYVGRPGTQMDAAKLQRREQSFLQMSGGDPRGISLAAYVARDVERFRLADMNGDGVVTRAEAMIAQMRLRLGNQRG